MNESNEGQESRGDLSGPPPSGVGSNPYAPSVTPGPPVVAPSNKEERNWALIAHLSSLSTFVGIPGFVGPLVVWLVKKDEFQFASTQAKEALNFQISLFIYSIVCLILFITVIGAVIAFPGLIALGILGVVFPIIAAIQAGEGKAYRYPMTIRLLA